MRSVVDVLSALVSKSLEVRQDDGGTQARFRLLQLIRQYGPQQVRAHRTGSSPIGVTPITTVILWNKRHHD